MQKNASIVRIYLWLAAGLIFAVIFGSMAASGDYNLKQFLKQGSTYTITQEKLQEGNETLSYDAGSGVFTIVSDTAKKQLPRLSECRKWKYLEFGIHTLSPQPYIGCLISYLDSSQNMVYEQYVTFYDSENLVASPQGIAFQYIVLHMDGQNGQSYSIDHVQARDAKTPLTLRIWIEKFVAYLMVYLCLSVMIYMVKRMNWNSCITGIQNSCIRLVDPLGEHIHRRWTGRIRRKARRVLFFLLFTLLLLAGTTGSYTTADGYHWCLLLVVAVCFLIGILCWEHRLHTVDWNTGAAVCWFLFWGLVCLSDFMAVRQLRYTGYACLTGVTFLFFLWNQMKDVDALWLDLCIGAAATAPVVILGELFRGHVAGDFGNGIITVREDMALYALTLCLLSCILVQYVKHILTKVLCGLLCVVGMYYTWLTQLPVCMFGTAIVLLLWLLRAIRGLKTGREEKNGLQVLVVLGIAAVTAGILIALQSNGILLNPYAAGRSIPFAEKQQIWIGYIREIDLFGNDEALRTLGYKTMANSGWLELIYRYGIFPVFAFLPLCVCYGREIWKTRHKSMLLVFGIFQLLYFTQNLEKPFYQPLWILFIFGIGRYMKRTE